MNPYEDLNRLRKGVRMALVMWRTSDETLRRNPQLPRRLSDATKTMRSKVARAAGADGCSDQSWGVAIDVLGAIMASTYPEAMGACECGQAATEATHLGPMCASCADAKIDESRLRVPMFDMTGSAV